MPDVAFLLVIFFMITATFAATKGLEVNQSMQQEPGADGQDIVQLHVFADHAQLDCSPVEAGEVAGRLRSILSRDPGRPVVLVVEPDVRYARMVSFYDELVALRRAGLFDDVQMPTHGDREAYARIWDVDPFLDRCRR